MKDLFNDIKASVAAGDFAGAVNAAKSARKTFLDDYFAASKAAKIFGKIPLSGLGLKKVKLAFLSSSSTVFFEPVLKLFGLLDGFDFEIKSGDFGNWRQDILNPSSWLYAFAPDIVCISVNWRDAALPALSESPATAASAVVSEFVGYWDILKKNSNAVIIQQNLDLPRVDSSGFLSQTSPHTRAQVLKLAAVELVKAAYARGVLCIDAQELRAEIGAAKWEDERLWVHGRQHPSPSALPRLAAEYVRALKAARGASKKVCVVDLDNTLWGGVVGEDGADGIVLGAPDADGEAYASFQKSLLELKERGVLLAVCTKNNFEDAVEPFEKNRAMVLKMADIASFKANWASKSQNIADIARELNLGLDSIVFFDDNPAEIAEVSAALPQVECVLLDADVSARRAQLLDSGYFDTAVVSEEDIARNKSYKAEAEREKLKVSAPDLDGFLKSLEMKCAVCDIDASTLPRVAQLLGKTNQFNLTTRRHSAEEIAKIAKTPNAYAKCFQLADKFGDSGIVGVVLALPAADGALETDSFVISCRAIGRGLENFMANELFAFAEARGFSTVRGLYIPTAKNAQTEFLYEKLGFLKEGDSEGCVCWSAKLPAKRAGHFIAQ